MSGGPSGPRPSGESINESGICLLSLDGGGVRGLSSLYILQNIMAQVNSQRAKEGLPPRKPCEVFDLIGGTSTGGLIAIMLGRLEMDVDECIAAYSELVSSVFHQKLHRFRLSLKGTIQARFDSQRLKDAIELVMHKRGISPSDMFNEGDGQACKVFVCATSKSPRSVHRLRSYETESTTTSINATICEAALATSAATSFFDPVTIGDMEFVDGALGANNPVGQVEAEAVEIWCPQSAMLQRLVKCFVSIGTGEPGVDNVDYRADKLANSLKRMATETRETAEDFVRRWRQQADEGRYFRFNVQHGLKAVGLAEHEAKGKMRGVTYSYLDEHEQKTKTRDCAANLRLKNRRADRTLEATLREATDTMVGVGLRSLADSFQFRSDPSISNHVSNSGTIMLPLIRNPNFVGRDEVLEELNAKFFGQNPHDRLALVGLGGVGKTQTAFHFADSVQKSKPDISIFWINALSSASFEQSCAEIIGSLGIQNDDDNDKESPKTSLKRALGSREFGEWLLIIDNADEYDMVVENPKGIESIKQFLPMSPHGRILFTTRSEKVADSVARGGVIELESLDIETATRFLEMGLTKRVQSLLRDTADVVALLKELGCIPLAITQAIAYLNQNQMSITEYLKRLRGTETGLVALMSAEFTDDTRYKGRPNAIATTWIVSFDSISRRDSEAAQKATELLYFISCIEPKAISRSMLKLWRGEDDAIILDEAIGILKEFSFLVEQQGGNVYDMHSLVHLATRIWIQQKNLQEEWLKAATEHLAEIFPETKWPNRHLWREYLPHALKVLEENAETDLEANFKLNYGVGSCLRREQRDKDAATCFQRCYDWAERELPITHKWRLSSVGMLASLHSRIGKPKEAIAMIESVLEKLTGPEIMMPPNNPHILRLQEVLAISFKRSGQMEKCIKLLELVISQGSRLMSRHNLAIAYSDIKEYRKASEILEDVVETEKQTLPEGHPDTLRTLRLLADAYINLDQTQKAAEIMERAVLVWRTTAPEDDRNRRVAESALGGIYNLQQQYEKAIPMLERLVALEKKIVPEEDKDHKLSQDRLAFAYFHTKQYDKAVEIWEAVVAVQRRFLPEKHVGRRSSEHWLGCSYYYAGQFDKAIEVFEALVAVEQRFLPKNDSDRQRCERFLRKSRRASTPTLARFKNLTVGVFKSGKGAP